VAVINDDAPNNHKNKTTEKTTPRYIKILLILNSPALLQAKDMAAASSGFCGVFSEFFVEHLLM